MKIKNILALSLIAVISGISTAQTYTATAGTNGATDIQSDYSMATGDGASVSVDVPLEFELPKKVAIAVDATGAGFPSSELFTDVSNVTPVTSALISDLSQPLNSNFPNLVWPRMVFHSAIYANTAISFTADFTDFLHESDPNSSFKTGNFVSIRHYSGSPAVASISDDNDSTTTAYPGTVNIDDSTLISTENKLVVRTRCYIYKDTVDPTDRAGKYLGTATFTVSTL